MPEVALSTVSREPIPEGAVADVTPRQRIGPWVSFPEACVTRGAPTALGRTGSWHITNRSRTYVDIRRPERHRFHEAARCCS
ncbi:MAG: hypothetical protein ACRETD_01575 [Steroidobacteraceae bacterium]